VAPGRRCQKSGNNFHLVEDINDGTLGGANGDPGAPTINARKTLMVGPLVDDGARDP
jgi:hypothetical protein